MTKLISDIRPNYKVQDRICLNCDFSKMTDFKKNLDFRVLVCNFDGDLENAKELNDEEYALWVKEHEVDYAVCDLFQEEKD